jgi:hypothetical protein
MLEAYPFWLIIVGQNMQLLFISNIFVQEGSMKMQKTLQIAVLMHSVLAKRRLWITNSTTIINQKGYAKD